MGVIEGSIESWNNNSGFGIIRGADEKTYRAHHSNFQEKGRKIVMEIGQDVSFTPDGGHATDISYDTRSALFRFAYFHNYEKAIDELAREHAVPEKWSSSMFDENALRKAVKETAENNNWFNVECDKQIKKYGKIDEKKAKQRVEDKVAGIVFKEKYEILISYFERTFERVRLENKIEYSDDLAAFNTSLGNKFNKDIYAVFKKNRAGDGWQFEKFADDNFVGKAFPSIPEPPNYFIDIATRARVPSDHLFLDVEKRIFADDTHLFDERRSRFPESWKEMNDEECVSSFDRLLDRTQRRVRRNFRAAVPFYYPALRKIQMLLPVTFFPGTAQEETHALVVTRVGAGYSVETIMPLPWAYKNARLLAKPDREDWLDF